MKREREGYVLSAGIAASRLKYPLMLARFSSLLTSSSLPETDKQRQIQNHERMDVKGGITNNTKHDTMSNNWCRRIQSTHTSASREKLAETLARLLLHDMAKEILHTVVDDVGRELRPGEQISA